MESKDQKGKQKNIDKDHIEAQEINSSNNTNSRIIDITPNTILNPLPTLKKRRNRSDHMEIGTEWENPNKMQLIQARPNKDISKESQFIRNNYNNLQYSSSDIERNQDFYNHNRKEFISCNSLVPYYHDWKVILRNQISNQMVLYNQDSHELAITPSQSLVLSSSREKSGKCRLCLQTLPGTFNHESGSHDSSPETSYEEKDEFINDKGDESIDFMDRNYFKCLSISHIQQKEKNLLSHTSMPLNDDKYRTKEGILSEGSLNQGYYERFFKEVKKLGRGASGNVYLCQHVLDNIMLGNYAIKKVSIGHDHSWLERMLREVHMLEKLHHQNIIEYKHAWIENHKLSPFSPEVPCLFILMECANGGNLEEFVEKRKSQSSEEVDLNSLTPKQRALYMRRQAGIQREKIFGTSSNQGSNSIKDSNLLTLKEIWSLFLDICHGLAHLHKYGIIHRDIKPPNLLISYNEKDRSDEIPRVLISDFGECVNVENMSNCKRTGATGTLEFMAPELIKVDYSGAYIGEHSPKADMWSLGMVLYYLCYSKLPYKQIEDIEILQKEMLGFRGIEAFPDDLEMAPRIPSLFKQLIVLLLSTQPSKRPSAEDILNKAKNVQFSKLTPGFYNTNYSHDSQMESTSSWSESNNKIGSNEVKDDSSSNFPFTPKKPSPLNNIISDNKETTPLISNKSFREVSNNSFIEKASSTPSPILLLIFGIKLATIIFPCYPRSMNIIVLIPLTTLAVWSLYNELKGFQIFFLGLHALILGICIYSGNVCS